MDELAVLDGGKCILQLRGVRPFLSNKYDLTKHPLYRYTADYDKKYAFDIERFLSHRLKLKPDDAVEVYQADLSGEPCRLTAAACFDNDSMKLRGRNVPSKI